jgi:hypothetical protein
MGMFNKIVNKVRSFFGSTPNATNAGVRIRNTSPSLGRLFRERGRVYHQSNEYTVVEGKHGIPQIVRKGHTLTLGRNAFKRACKAAGINRVKAERALAGGMSAVDAFRYGAA